LAVNRAGIGRFKPVFDALKAEFVVTGR